MMNLNSYAESFVKRNIINFVLTDLKREIKEDTVFVMKSKTNISNVLRKQTRSWFSNFVRVSKHTFGHSGSKNVSFK